jgi:glycosyltransferase involved in cell wall biosynthesis
MRIAIVNHGIFPFLMGGMERHTHFLASHLASLGADVEVIIPTLKPEQTATFAAEKHPFRLVQFPWPPARLWLRSNYLFSKAAALHLAEGDFDAVYCQGFNGWAYLAQAHGARRALALFNPHGLEMFKAAGLEQTVKTYPMRWAAKEQARLADRVISLGGGLTDEVRRFLRVTDERIDVLPNAVDLAYIDSFNSPPKDTGGNRFIFVGRLEANKGVGYLCDAFEGLGGAHLTIVGAGPLEADLRSRFAGSHIEFTGRLDDARLFELYRQSDCFVFASLYEGMPTVVLEAMSCGLPIIATDIGAVRTMVDRENGFIVQPGSTPELRSAVENFLKLSALTRSGMSEASRSRVVERFSWPKVASLTLRTIEQHTVRRTGRFAA